MYSSKSIWIYCKIRHLCSRCYQKENWRKYTDVNLLAFYEEPCSCWRIWQNRWDSIGHVHSIVLLVHLRIKTPEYYCCSKSQFLSFHLHQNAINIHDVYTCNRYFEILTILILIFKEKFPHQFNLCSSRRQHSLKHYAQRRIPFRHPELSEFRTQRQLPEQQPVGRPGLWR